MQYKHKILTVIVFAAIVIFLGHALVNHSGLLRKFAIPAPVVSGLLFSIVVAILKGSGVIALSFDVKTVQDLCQNVFFMCVGFGFSWKLIRHAGGKLCVAFLHGSSSSTSRWEYGHEYGRYSLENNMA